MPGGGIPQNPTQPMTQIPIFPIPVQSNESYLLYALCLHAIEAGIYTDMPNILPQLTAMKQGLEMAYTKLGVPMFEYRRFVVSLASDGIIDALEDWVAGHPEEAEQPFKTMLSEVPADRACTSCLSEGAFWSAKDILREIKNHTERGKMEYRTLVQLTIDLLVRGRIQTPPQGEGEEKDVTMEKEPKEG